MELTYSIFICFSFLIDKIYIIKVNKNIRPKFLLGDDVTNSPEVSINGFTLPIVLYSKYLGITFDSKHR